MTMTVSFHPNIDGWLNYMEADINKMADIILISLLFPGTINRRLFDRNSPTKIFNTTIFLEEENVNRIKYALSQLNIWKLALEIYEDTNFGPPMFVFIRKNAIQRLGPFFDHGE